VLSSRSLLSSEHRDPPRGRHYRWIKDPIEEIIRHTIEVRNIIPRKVEIRPAFGTVSVLTCKPSIDTKLREHMSTRKSDWSMPCSSIRSCCLKQATIADWAFVVLGQLLFFDDGTKCLNSVCAPSEPLSMGVFRYLIA
jgi:hypothetical protein